MSLTLTPVSVTLLTKGWKVRGCTPVHILLTVKHITISYNMYGKTNDLQQLQLHKG